MTAMNKKILQHEPEEIQALLPWHAVGALSARDARRVEAALACDPSLARQYAAIREECSETVALNEGLGAPSARAMQKLFAAVDAEPKRSPSPPIAARITEFLARLSPRALACAVGLGALALMLQAGVIGAILATQQRGGFQAASLSDANQTMIRATGSAAGPRLFVRFSPDARLSDITALLEANQASIVDSTGGRLLLQFGDKPMSRQEITDLMTRLHSEKIIQLAAPAR
jgi:hypothetical protein